jgi:hypothetical protein
MADTEQLKREIRRRLYRQKRLFSEWFETCTACRGRGRCCETYFDPNLRAEVVAYGPCDQCNGEGFVERDRPVEPGEEQAAWRKH